MTARHWTEAKIPQWAKDSIDADLAAYKLTAALSWPTQEKPQPLPFQWGGYDILHGEAEPGTFWNAHWGHGGGHTQKVHIREQMQGESGYKKWRFSRDGEQWHANVTRGPLFASEADARLWMLWEACEDFAKKLQTMRVPA